MSTTQPHPEVSRPYFEREQRKGARVIFSWHVLKRWPDYGETAYPEWIEGVEFQSVDAAKHFDIEEGLASSDDLDYDGPWVLFETWEEAEQWIHHGG